MTQYARPESIVETQWLEDNLDDAGIRIVEVDVDIGAYVGSHVPGAIQWDRMSHLNPTVRRDILDIEQMQRLLGESGIRQETRVILYGDYTNRFASYAFWQMKIYGHRQVSVLNGGREKWIAEGRPPAADLPAVQPVDYVARQADTSIRALRDQVLRAASSDGAIAMVDVRSPAKYNGEALADRDLPRESSQREGHIPGAVNLPCEMAFDADDGTFKPVDQLRDMCAASGVTGDREIITYCRVGERSSLSWFVLTQVLGYERVRNYDGSWWEYSSLIGAPIER